MSGYLDQRAFEPFVENRRSFILLRWLLIILSTYLVLSGNVADNRLTARSLVTVAGFFLSNLVIALLPPRALEFVRTRHIVVVLDAVFISMCLDLLRVDGPPIHMAFIGIFLVSLIWTDLRVITFVLLVASIVFGALSSWDVFGFGAEVPVGDFLSLSLLFVISVFYVFLSNRFDRDSATATVMLEERRNSEIMVEMTRTLGASMNADDIYRVVVTGLGAARPQTLFRVVQIEGDKAQIEASSDGSTDGGDGTPAPLTLDSVPTLRRASEEKKTVIARFGTSTEVAVPMITQGEVVGAIWCRSPHAIQSDGMEIHLFEVVAGSAANAIRNVRLLDEMKHMARTDFLTGLPNHRHFRQTLRAEMGRAERHERPMSLLVLDLDFLKSVNDRFGHPAGDVVIRSVGETIRSACRRIDFAARYGGEEFVVILPDTDLQGAVDVAERIRENILNADMGEVGQVTASIGVANYPVNALNEEDLVRVADQALYVAKNGGRNQVAHFKYELTSP